MIVINYGKIRGPDPRNHLSMYFKVNEPNWVFHKKQLVDPQVVMVAIFIFIIILWGEFDAQICHQGVS